MEKRTWEAPKTKSWDDLDQALGDCSTGETALGSTSDCTEGAAPNHFLQSCTHGTYAADPCSMGYSPNLEH